MAEIFNGTLNRHELFDSLFNLITQQIVFSDNLKGKIFSLADTFRSEGSEYGDTSLYISVQLPPVMKWKADDEAENLLKLHRPEDPYQEKITLNQFRMIALSTDNYLSKRALANEQVFSQFNSTILSTMQETRKVYEACCVNTAVGTMETALGKQTQTVELESGTTEEDNRLNAQYIAKKVASILTDVQDVSGDYNDLGYTRAYSPDDFLFIWNSDWYHQILKVDLPTIFHKDGLIDRLGEHILPARYFGTPNTVSKVTGDANTRALDAYYDEGTDTYYNAGDSLNGVTLVSDGEIIIPSYQVDPSVIVKIVAKNGLVYKSGFNHQSSFYNPRSNTTTNFILFGHSDLQNGKSRLNSRPWITLKAE